MAECRLDTLAGCELVIGAYPRFHYNALGGYALGHSEPEIERGVALRFATHTTTIPPLSWRSTRFLGLPLPPGLTIAIAPEALSGTLEPDIGKVELQFRSRFRLHLQAGQALRYAATDLVVDTTLTTEAISSRRHQRQGRRLDAINSAVLVGSAVIEPCGEVWLDRFLGLPNEALAVLHCRLTF